MHLTKVELGRLTSKGPVARLEDIAIPHSSGVMGEEGKGGVRW